MIIHIPINAAHGYASLPINAAMDTSIFRARIPTPPEHEGEMNENVARGFRNFFIVPADIITILADQNFTMNAIVMVLESF